MKIDENPFERWDLDPGKTPRELTASMRQKSRQLPADKRGELQEDWRRLTSDPVERARWIALTPPPVDGDSSDPWDRARQLVDGSESSDLPALRPTLEDALVLPLMNDEQLRADPPFLPEILRCEHRRGDRT